MAILKKVEYILFGKHVKRGEDGQWREVCADFDYDPQHRVVHFGGLSLTFDQIIALAVDVEELSVQLASDTGAALVGAK